MEGHLCVQTQVVIKPKMRVLTKQLGCLDEVQMKITLSRMIPLIQIDIGLDKNLIF